MTSTGLLTQNRYRRVTLQELFSSAPDCGTIPPTFDSRDLKQVFGVNTEQSAVLLMNTGLWVARCDSLDGIWFSLRDYGVNVNGAFAARVWPEDWGFSEECVSRGLRIAATTKVPTWHGDPSNTYGKFGIAHDDWVDR